MRMRIGSRIDRLMGQPCFQRRAIWAHANLLSCTNLVLWPRTTNRLDWPAVYDEYNDRSKNLDCSHLSRQRAPPRLQDCRRKRNLGWMLQATNSIFPHFAQCIIKLPQSLVMGAYHMPWQSGSTRKCHTVQLGADETAQPRPAWACHSSLAWN